MSVFKKAEEIFFTGKVIKDYGVIQERGLGLGALKNSVTLSEKSGEKKVMIKESAKSFLSVSVRYSEFDKIGAQKLKMALEDALQYM